MDNDDFSSPEGALERTASKEGAPGSVGVYAAAAGLAAALPIPFLDALLSEGARGAAMRRVAARHGVRLTRDARRALAGPGKLEGGRPLRVVRSVVSRVVMPLRMANRVEDAFAAFASASLLDHYLRTSPRRSGAPMAEAEARRVRRAMDGAAVEGLLRTLKRAPEGAGQLGSNLVAAVRGSDTEDRTPIERLLDAILDTFADGPGELIAEVRERFDASLEKDPPELPR